MRPSASSVANPNPFLSRVKQTYGIKAAKKLHFKNDLENNCRYEESDYVTENNAVKVLHSICQRIWKTQQWPQDWEKSVFIPIPKKGNSKECSNFCTIALISHITKVMLKILQARLLHYVNHELSDVQAGFRKGRGTIDQIANVRWIIKKAREFHKNIYFCFIDYAKSLTVWITINCGKF